MPGPERRSTWQVSRGTTPRIAAHRSRRSRGISMTKNAVRPAVLTDPITNRGAAFTTEERSKHGLVGRLPSAVLTLDQQAQRAYAQLQEQPGDLAKNVYLEGLHDRNEVLYYRVL